MGEMRHRLPLDVHHLVVVLERDLVSGADLAFVQDLVLVERLHDVGLHELGERVHRVPVVQQAAPSGLVRHSCE